MTALQELIEIIKNKRKESDISNTLLRFCQVEAEKLLSKEQKEKSILLNVKEWSHTCGDGCCYTWGTDVFINNENITNGDCNNIDYILKDVLEHFGYEVIFSDDAD